MKETISPTVYVDALISRSKMTPQNVIIDDIRMPEEIDRLREEYPDGLFVRVSRNIETTLTEAQRAHRSESQIDQCVVDYTLDNNRTIAETADDLSVLVNSLVVKRPQRFYIAGPLSIGDYQQNVERATRAFDLLVQLGHAAYCPHEIGRAHV